MTATDMSAWAADLRAKYGIVWPISLTLEPEDFDEVMDDLSNPINAIPFNPI